jgi:hypothetical protein
LCLTSRNERRTLLSWRRGRCIARGVERDLALAVDATASSVPAPMSALYLDYNRLQ